MNEEDGNGAHNPDGEMVTRGRASVFIDRFPLCKCCRAQV